MGDGNNNGVNNKGHTIIMILVMAHIVDIIIVTSISIKSFYC